ncbi:hypothetical protein ACP70R_011043 [Stipagrostis hirtigluma subsp. patula]
MAAASAVAASPRAPDPLHLPAPDFSGEASSSSSTSLATELRSGFCEGAGDGEGAVLDLDSPWVAAAEVELILEAAAAEAAAAALKISGEEELEEEEIRDNQQRQEDELMALEAIYGDDLAVFENKGGLQYFQIKIRYDVADGTGVCANLSSASVCSKDEGCSDGIRHGDGLDVFSYNCNLDYLPPLILTCLLPRSYPSKDPPFFTVSAKWMDGPQVSQLCEMLDTIWAELPGQEVVYQWVEWLRNSSRSHLWFDGKMTLGPDPVAYNGDNRAISRTNSLESVIPLILTYSSKKRYQAFLDNIHTCNICLNQSKDASGSMSERDMAKELLSIRKLCDDVQLCPKCRMAIVKTEGCNKMACGNCGQLLCFRCGRAISGYEHFRDCELFAMSEYSDVEPWERHMDEMQVARRKRVELSPIGASVRCPKCRQRNFKEDEKYIFCWACRIHYCALCRMRVEDRYMRSGHYGSSECVGLGNF